jgi:hypothetical protein
MEPSPGEDLLMTSDDPLPTLEDRLAALHAMGRVEFEPAERELIAAAMAELDRMSKEAMQTIGGSQP